MHLAKDHRGMSQLGLILGMVVILVAGALSWWVWQNNSKNHKTSNVSQTTEDAVKDARCAYDDQDLCKFFAGWKIQKAYAYTSTTTQADGSKNTSLVKSQDNSKFYVKLSGDTSYEIIQIGDVMYTKATDGTWWKQTLAKSDLDKYRPKAQTDLREPGADSSAERGDDVRYKKMAKEKCGDTTCFKYQAIDPGDTKTTTYIWFNDQNYQLRRIQTITSDYTWDSTYTYDKVSIAEPSPVKDLQPNQSLLPGQSEPTTLPATGDTGDYPDLINQQ